MNKRTAIALAALFTSLPACGVSTPEPGCDDSALRCSMRVEEGVTVADPEVGLVWQRGASPQPLDWEGALEYCAEAADTDRRDWFLPTSEQLASIYAGGSAGLNPYVFSPIHSSYWSASTLAADKARILKARGGGGFSEALMAERHYAKCARFTAPRFVAGLEKDVTLMAAGEEHVCVLQGADVLCWGANDVGQLGDGTRVSRAGAKPVVGLRTGKIKQLYAGYLHTCALFDDGRAQCWGQNYDGQLGAGTSLKDEAKPVDVQLTGIRAMALGSLHSCALLTDGGVRCWGFGLTGALGTGGDADSLTPVSPAGLNSGVAAIAAGPAHTCALLSNKTVQCWGWNQAGEVGNGTLDRTLSPVTVAGLTNVNAIWARGGTRAKGKDLVFVGATCALTQGGRLSCWGANDYGQLGIGTSAKARDGSSDQYSPVDITGLAGKALSLALGLEHACATTDAGGLWCWGRNDDRQLGDGTPLERNVPSESIVSFDDGAVASVVAGQSFTCALSTKGAVSCWGANDIGQLGE